MQIQRITITLLRVTGSHPVTAVHGAQHRNYYFFKGNNGEAFTRIYDAGDDTEARRDRGIFPLEMARADMHDLANGNLHPAALMVELATVEEVEAEIAEAAAARKRAEEEEKARNDLAAELEAQAERAAGEAKAVREGAPLPPAPESSEATEDATAPAAPDADSAPAPAPDTKPAPKPETPRAPRRGAKVNLPGK